jgi:hypothetical protein
MKKLLGGVETNKVGTPYHHKQPMKKEIGAWSVKIYFICRKEFCGRMIYLSELRDTK